MCVEDTQEIQQSCLSLCITSTHQGSDQFLNSSR